jgi:hypothetical protein
VVETWRCAGCGIEGPDKARRCDCVTSVIISSDGAGAWKVRTAVAADRIDAAMLRSMASSFRGSLAFSFNQHDMADLLVRVADRIEPRHASVESI